MSSFRVSGHILRVSGHENKYPVTMGKAREGAVRFLREAYEVGLPHGPYLFTRWDLRPLSGYKPFEDMMRPKG